MTGSRRWFGYTTDRDVKLAMSLDESTYEKADFGFNRNPGSDHQTMIAWSKILRPRYVLAFRDDNPSIRRRLFCGTRQSLENLAKRGHVSLDGRRWSILSYHGEKGLIRSGRDTGQTDGDN